MSQSGIIKVQSGSLPPDVPTSFVLDTGVAIPLANVIEINGAGGITVTEGASNQIIITGSGGGSGYTWQVVTSINNPVILAKNNAYITKGVSAVNFILPASASIGDMYQIVGYGNLWTIAQNANQSITIGILASTVGIGGSITATTSSDCLELVCVTTNLEWREMSMQGSPTII